MDERGDRPFDRVRVKICGLTRREDALLADQLGADYLGVVLTAGFGRSVDPEAAAALVAGTKATRVAVLVNESPDEAESRARALGAGVIQLQGEEDVSVFEALRSRGEWKLWKCVRARSSEDVERAVGRYGEVADGILVEGWKEGVVGGGGAALTARPEAVRAAISEDLDFVLAGGLRPDNVARAVALLRPDVVDVSSGIETAPRQKAPELVHAFIDAVRIASRSLRQDDEPSGQSSASDDLDYA